MKILVQSPDFKAQPELIDFVNEKLQKLELFTDRIIEARVLLKLDKSDSRENKVSEVKLVIPGNDLFASKQAKTFEEATVKTVDALKKQIEEWKKKND
ncbi:MAG TPA: HPF/RaiA family ribosome-associated protein [Ohtaekwangia sp.]|nr:HPF/RaiA family ribosome-associated protein [Ohtaekwangia sp.]